MKVYVNSITGIDDAIVSTMMSKRSWTREKEVNVRGTCERLMNNHGKFCGFRYRKPDDFDNYNKWLDAVLRYGCKHITLLRYIDISVTVNGLHRGGQDDWDSHAKRFDNRIVRSSTRLSRFGNEKSDWYKDRIITDDEVFDYLHIVMPEEIEKDGVKYVKAVNGYVREDLKDDNDTLRGLYMLSIPSDFIFKINLTEFAHVYKMRNQFTTSHPEVKECCELIADKIALFQPKFTKELFGKIQN